MTTSHLARVRLTPTAKAANFDHALDDLTGTVCDRGEGWAEVLWPGRLCSWHKAADLEVVTIRTAAAP